MVHLVGIIMGFVFRPCSLPEIYIHHSCTRCPCVFWDVVRHWETDGANVIVRVWQESVRIRNSWLHFLSICTFFFFFGYLQRSLSHHPPLISLSQHVSYSDEAKCCRHCSYSLSHIFHVALWSGSKPFHTTSFILSQRAQKTTKLTLSWFGVWCMIFNFN